MAVCSAQMLCQVHIKSSLKQDPHLLEGAQLCCSEGGVGLHDAAAAAPHALRQVRHL